MRWPWSRRAPAPKLRTGPRLRWKCGKCGYEAWSGGYGRPCPPPDPLPSVTYCGPGQRRPPCSVAIKRSESDQHLHDTCPRCEHVTFRECRDSSAPKESA